MKHTVSSLERALTVLIAVLIIGSAIAYVYAGESARALRITAETYDRWLKPCTCYGGTLRVAL
ncbi:MAG: hypothetical protein QXZ37_05760, partial [Sulfolobales archaeon]